jgi:hypothetical protein
MIRAAQIGNYVEGQGANRRHYLGVNPDRVAHAVFLNYLAVNGRMQDYAKVATGRERLLPVGDARAMDSLLMFRNFG